MFRLEVARNSSLFHERRYALEALRMPGSRKGLSRRKCFHIQQQSLSPQRPSAHYHGTLFNVERKT